MLQEQSRLLKTLQDKDELIEKQKEEIDLLNLVSAASIIIIILNIIIC